MRLNDITVRFWWAIQWPVWWLFPNSSMFCAVRRKYAREVRVWIGGRKI
jgi:hypothetical protein